MAEKNKDKDKKLDEKRKEFKKLNMKDQLKSIITKPSNLRFALGFKNGGKVAKGCGAVLPNRRKKTKYY